MKGANKAKIILEKRCDGIGRFLSPCSVSYKDCWLDIYEILFYSDWVSSFNATGFNKKDIYLKLDFKKAYILRTVNGIKFTEEIKDKDINEAIYKLQSSINRHFIPCPSRHYFLYFLKIKGGHYKIGITSGDDGDKFWDRIERLKRDAGASSILFLYTGEKGDVKLAETAIKNMEIASIYKKCPFYFSGWTEVFSYDISKFPDFHKQVGNLRLIGRDIII